MSNIHSKKILHGKSCWKIVGNYNNLKKNFNSYFFLFLRGKKEYLENLLTVIYFKNNRITFFHNFFISDRKLWTQINKHQKIFQNIFSEMIMSGEFF
jgi:hypothetical protein